MTSKLTEEQKSNLSKGLFSKVRNRALSNNDFSRGQNIKKFCTYGPLIHSNRRFRPAQDQKIRAAIVI